MAVRNSRVTSRTTLSYMIERGELVYEEQQHEQAQRRHRRPHTDRQMRDTTGGKARRCWRKTTSR